MTDLTDLDYAFILCFKQCNHDNATLLRRLMAEQAEWAGIPVSSIGVNDVAYMINGTVARLGILSDYYKIHRWYDGMRTDALSNQISGYNPMNAIFDELATPDHYKVLAEFYIRHILSFADAIRWTMTSDIPGLVEYREAHKEKYPIRALDKLVDADSITSHKQEQAP